MTAEADASFAHGTLTAEAVRRLDVTHRVALETLRMYPIAPAITRTVSNTFEFAGYTIPAGEKVIVATTVPHHLPQYFPEPERFDIERYTPERQEHRQPGVFVPFGAGPHVCLGAGFAEVSIAATMATIVHEVELAPGSTGLRSEDQSGPHPQSRRPLPDPREAPAPAGRGSDSRNGRIAAGATDHGGFRRHVIGHAVRERTEGRW